MSAIDARWVTIDPWWAEYVHNQERGLIELRQLLDELDQVWGHSESQSDEDPLVGEWTSSRSSDGEAWRSRSKSVRTSRQDAEPFPR